MSDYGDIGYLPDASAADSCYVALRDCQLSAVIIGKRYGSLDKNGLSVTNNEFNAAREANIPVIALVDRDVIAYAQVFEANKIDGQKFPGMDAPDKTFQFLESIRKSDVNNGIVAYATVSEARTQLKRQIAHFIGNLLRRRLDPVQAQVKDILSELKTLRHDLRRGGAESDRSDKYLRAVRFLLDDQRERKQLGKLAEQLGGTLDQAVPLMLDSATFDDFLCKAKATVEVVDASRAGPDESEMEQTLYHSGWLISPEESSEEELLWGSMTLFTGNRLRMTEDSKWWFTRTYDEFRKYVLHGARLTSR